MASAQHTEDGVFGQAIHGTTATGEGTKTPPNSEAIPRPKRIACILCRKRKLKCDGSKPSCGTCSRLGHTCEYSEERKKSGPKRGYVKLLEARLKQVENLLETRDTPATSSTAHPPLPSRHESIQTAQDDELRMPSGHVAPLASNSMEGVVQDAFIDPTLSSLPDFGLSTSDNFSWEMIGLGLEEALPNQDIIDDLNRIYFEKIHPSLPMIHRGRFLASMDLAPQMRPCVALRYIMWAHACSVTSQYSAYTEHFYTRARKYAEQDEMRGHGENIVTLAHCQAWALLSCYEFKMMYFPRAWMSTGRSSRLALMMGLHRQDRLGLDVKQTLPPPRDWLDREERRRTFWMVYCQDRYASIGTGWPMEFDERDILTNLPASDEAFRTGQEERTQQLSEVLNGESTESISSFAGVILLATIYGRNLTHLHRPSEGDNDHDLNGEFWKRHRHLDNTLLNISLSMPAALRLPAALGDPNAIFCNMNIQTATICLHQAAIFKAEKNRLPAQISAESKRRCIVAADQVTNVMKMISHLDLSLMNPFLAFCLYVAARVFVQYLKSRKDDSAVKSSLHFLLSAMQVLKSKNPLTESFLVQLDVDIEGSGLELPNSSRNKVGRRVAGEVPANTDTVRCSPLFELRETQSVGQASREHGGDSTAYPTATTVDCHSIPPHLAPDTNFDGSDMLYNPQPPQQSQQSQNSGPSPGFVSGSTESTGSHSGLPTPASSSNRGGSYTGNSPYQYNSFSPHSSTSTNANINNNNNNNNKHSAASANANCNPTAKPVEPTFPEHLVFGSPAAVAAVEGATHFTDGRTSSVATWNFKVQNRSFNIPDLAASAGSGAGQHQQHQHQQRQQQHQQQQNPKNIADEFPFPNSGAAGGGVGGGEGGGTTATGMTPLPDTLWQSVMDVENDWMQGWSPGIQ